MSKTATKEHRLVKTIEMELVKIDTLMLDPANVRKHDQRNLDAIKASLTRFGQQHPIIVNGDGIVVAGNGRLMAAKSLGWTDIRIIRTELAGIDATAFAIADNRTAELADWDNDGLAQTLAALQNDEDFDHLVAGFTDTEIQKMIGGELNPDWESEWEGMPEFDQADRTSFRHVVVHFVSNKDADDFFRMIKREDTGKTMSIWFPPQENMDTETRRYGNES